MKTILIIIALAGFTAVSCYAQNTKNCCCRNKMTYKVAAIHHHKAVKMNKMAEYKPVPVESLAELNRIEKVPLAACYTYRKHNITVTECPGIMYDDAGNMQYSTEGTFMGNYPQHRPVVQEQNDDAEWEKGPVAPQHTTISNYKGIAPADGNSCMNCTPQ